MADPDGFSYLNNGRLASAYLILNVILQFIFYFPHFTLFDSVSASHKDSNFTKKTFCGLVSFPHLAGQVVGEKFQTETHYLFLVPRILN